LSGQDGAWPPCYRWRAGGLPDPHLDLEQVDGAKAMATVKAWNARTLDALEKQPHFAEYQSRALAFLSDTQKIAEPDHVQGGQVLNFWQDADHPRGLWRTSPVDAFAAGKPRWRTLIDVGALGQKEGHKWVFKGATCLSPAYVKCMVALSDGGGDAVTTREFDMTSARFIDGGFALPEAKTEASWAAPDALYVATDFGPGSTTDSGYARIVKLWKRGTPLASATLVSEGVQSDVSVSTQVIVDGERTWPLLVRGVDFYHHKLSHIAPDGRLVPTPLPDDADLDDVLDGRAIATLKSAWQGHSAGSVVAYSIPDLLAGKPPTIETVFVPNAHQAVEDVGSGKSVVWVKLLDDVSGRLLALVRAADGTWSGQAVALADKSTVHLNATASDSDTAFVTVEGMLTPPTLYRVTHGAAPVAVQALPAKFDASNMVVEQHFATSRDGTKASIATGQRARTTMS
jgi:prolyl oligopeptidase